MRTDMTLKELGFGEGKAVFLRKIEGEVVERAATTRPGEFLFRLRCREESKLDGELQCYRE